MKKLQSVDDIVQKYSVDNKPIKRILYISLGSLFLLFAVIGIWVPGWPTVSWAVPAAFFFFFFIIKQKIVYMDINK